MSKKRKVSDNYDNDIEMSKKRKVSDNYDNDIEKKEFCTKETQTCSINKKQKTEYECRLSKAKVILTSTDICNYRTRFKEAFNEWKIDDKWTPFLSEFTKKELKNMGYDVNVRHTINYLAVQIEYLKSRVIKCPICYNYPKTPIVLNCGHCMCSMCCNKVNNCPICREEIVDETKLFIN